MSSQEYNTSRFSVNLADYVRCTVTDYLTFSFINLGYDELYRCALHFTYIHQPPATRSAAAFFPPAATEENFSCFCCFPVEMSRGSGTRGPGLREPWLLQERRHPGAGAWPFASGRYWNQRLLPVATRLFGKPSCGC